MKDWTLALIAEEERLKLWEQDLKQRDVHLTTKITLHTDPTDPEHTGQPSPSKTAADVHNHRGSPCYDQRQFRSTVCSPTIHDENSDDPPTRLPAQSPAALPRPPTPVAARIASLANTVNSLDSLLDAALFASDKHQYAPISELEESAEFQPFPLPPWDALLSELADESAATLEARGIEKTPALQWGLLPPNTPSTELGPRKTIRTTIVRSSLTPTSLAVPGVNQRRQLDFTTPSPSAAVRPPSPYECPNCSDLMLSFQVRQIEYPRPRS